jgi:transketolase
VIVIEEHVPQGGLAPQTKQIAWDTQARCRLDTFTLQDKFIHNNGRHGDMLAAHGLSLAAISQRIGLG